MSNERIQKPGVYSRPETAVLWLRYWDETGHLVRRSSKTTDDRKAWGELELALASVEAKKRILAQRCAIDAGFTTFFSKGTFGSATRTRYETSMDHWLIFTNEEKITHFSQITKKVCSKFITWRRTRGVVKLRLRPNAETGKLEMQDVRFGITDSTIRHDFSFLSSCYSFLADDPDWEDMMPIYPMTKRAKKRQLAPAEERVRWANPDEWQSLIEACTTGQQKNILTFAAETGLREQNVCGLQWIDVDLERREVRVIHKQHLVSTKNKRSMVIALSEAAVLALQNTAKHADCLYVFWHLAKVPDPKREGCFKVQPQRFKSMANWWQAVRKRSGIKDFRYHDIRHTFASNYLNRGGELSTLQLLMGHSNITQTQKYAHALTELLHQGVRKVDKNRRITDTSNTKLDTE
jgi:integrase